MRSFGDAEGRGTELPLDNVVLAVLVRRFGKPDLFEHALLVPELRRIDREGQSDLGVADLEEVDLRVLELGCVVVGRVNERLQVQPLIGEGVGTAVTDGTHDVGRVAARYFGRECVVGLRVQDELAGDLDVVVRVVPILDDLLLDLDGLRSVTAAEAAIPPNDLGSGGHVARIDDDGGRNRCCRRLRFAGSRRLA